MPDITYQLNFTGDQINNLLTRTNNLDTELNNYLLKNGGTMTGGINMNSQTISGLNDPTEAAHAATKRYVDGLTRKAAPRNLLDNSDFRNPVNQRGNTSYSLSAWGGYCIDRWAAFASGGTVTIDSGGLTLSGNIFQPIASDVVARYNGKVLTFAAKISGTVYCCYGEVKQIGEWHYSAGFETPYGYIRFETENDNKMFVIIDSSTTSSVVEWAALYEGEYTAETLPEYQPKGYGAELAECQRYCLVIDWSATNYIAGYVTASTKTRVNAYFPLPVPMRTTPSLSSTDGSVWAVTIDGTAFTPTEAAIWFMSVNAILGMRFFFSSEIGLRKTGIANYNSGTKLILSADL